MVKFSKERYKYAWKLEMWGKAGNILLGYMSLWFTRTWNHVPWQGVVCLIKKMIPPLFFFLFCFIFFCWSLPFKKEWTLKMCGVCLYLGKFFVLWGRRDHGVEGYWRLTKSTGQAALPSRDVGKSDSWSALCLPTLGEHSCRTGAKYWPSEGTREKQQLSFQNVK